MAVQSRGGSSGALYVLVLFVFLFVIAVALAVLFYTQAAQFQEEAADAEEQLTEYVAKAETNAAMGELQAADQADRSLYAHLTTQRANLVRGITGDGSVPVEQAMDRLQGVGVDIDEGQYVIDVLNNLRNELQTKEGAISSLEQELQEAQARAEQAQRQLEQVREEEEQRIAELSQKLDELRGDFNAYQEKVDAAREDLVGQYEQRIADATDKVRQAESKVQQQVTQIMRLEQQIEQLKEELQPSRLPVPDPSTDADGRIVSVLSEKDLVYIDLGRRDHLVLGLTFEVFDGERGVEIEDAGEGRTDLARGKATIEVVSIESTSAACRIVRQTLGKSVLVNDVIANAVYDRDRTFKFHVHGRFDLDNDGETSIADYERVVSLIRQWGGNVVEELELDTDFLILGKQPPIPEPLDPDEQDPDRIRQNIRQKKQWEEYQSLVTEAKQLSIPVLNQNRFLTLIGYYQR